MPLKDPDARARYQKQHRLKHLVKYTERDREYRKTHKEEIYEKNRVYVTKNLDKHRQWVRKANRTWRAHNTKKFSAIVEDYRQRHPERRRANILVYEAVKRGTLVRPNQCSQCRKPCKPQAHHPDYSKPLEVIWLCSPCHKQADLKGAKRSSSQPTTRKSERLR